MNPLNETLKRLGIAREFNAQAKKKALGVILVGSVAYAPNKNVTESSDLDLIVVYEDINDCIDLYFNNEKEKQKLRHSNYDGFLVKQNINGVAVSVHNLSASALTKIAETDQQNLFYYRQKAKDSTYYSKDFSGRNHPFKVQSVSVEGLKGQKRIDPISFYRNGKFVMGNDIDKLLSGAVILHDTKNFVEDSIESLWLNMARKMIDHFGKPPAVENSDMSKFLCRSERFSPYIKNKIEAKTKTALKLACRKV